jgi:hypothetical protein
MREVWYAQKSSFGCSFTPDRHVRLPTRKRMMYYFSTPNSILEVGRDKYLYETS